MQGSITQLELSARLGGCLAALDGALRDAGALTRDPVAAATLADFAALVRSIEPRSACPLSTTEHLPVCRFLAPALTAASGSLADALRELAPSLTWAQNPNYRRRPPGPTFLDSYGYAVIAGPADGPPALVVDTRLALGVLLLGPGTHYPLHAHPAVEVYYTLTAGEWWRGGGPWQLQGPGTAIHHAPHVRHATRAGTSPLLAVYLWQGDLATHASLTAPTS